MAKKERPRLQGNEKRKKSCARAITFWNILFLCPSLQNWNVKWLKLSTPSFHKEVVPANFTIEQFSPIRQFLDQTGKTNK